MFIFLVDIEEEFFIAKDEYEWTFMSGKKKKKKTQQTLFTKCVVPLMSFQNIIDAQQQRSDV